MRNSIFALTRAKAARGSLTPDWGAGLPWRTSRGAGAPLPRQQRVNPSELNQSQAGFERARPVPTEIWRITCDPMFQPRQAGVCGALISQDVSALREPHE